MTNAGNKQRGSQMVEVTHTPGSVCHIGGRRGVVKSLLREGEPARVVALVYWDGGAMSFEREKDLR